MYSSIVKAKVAREEFAAPEHCQYMEHDPMATLKELELRRELLTAEELAALLNVSEKTVYRWSKLGSLPSVRLGTTVRFEPAVVSMWLRERGAAA